MFGDQLVVQTIAFASIFIVRGMQALFQTVHAQLLLFEKLFALARYSCVGLVFAGGSVMCLVSMFLSIVCCTNVLMALVLQQQPSHDNRWNVWSSPDANDARNFIEFCVVISRMLSTHSTPYERNGYLLWPEVSLDGWCFSVLPLA